MFSRLLRVVHEETNARADRGKQERRGDSDSRLERALQIAVGKWSTDLAVGMEVPESRGKEGCSPLRRDLGKLAAKMLGSFTCGFTRPS